MLYRDGLTFDPNQLRPALRLGFAKSRKEHLKIFLGDQRDAPVVEPPELSLSTMDAEELASKPGLRYYW
jgi:hypothetical protein